MKKLLIAAVTSLLISVSASPVKASGIPVVDVASILQTVTEGIAEAARFQQEIQGAVNRFNELKDQGEHFKDMVEGHYNFEDIINDPAVSEFMNNSEWREIYNEVGDVSDLRAEFGLLSDDPTLQEQYDRRLRQVKAQQRFHDASVARNEQLKDLAEQFENADTPAKKEDLANAISLQQLQIENDKNTMQTLTALMQKKANLEEGTAARESIRKMFNEGIPRT